MNNIQLQTTHRTVIGKKVKQLRREGIIPITLYGSAIAPLSLQVSERSLQRTLYRSGATQLIALEVVPEGEVYPTLAREIQVDPLSQRVLHVDFQAVIMDQVISAAVPVVLTGESEIAQQGLGVLVQNLDGIEVEALPAELPSEIRVDLSILTEIGQRITVSELSEMAGVRMLADPTECVVQIVPVRIAATEEVGEGVEETAMGEEEIAETGDQESSPED